MAVKTNPKTIKEIVEFAKHNNGYTQKQIGEKFGVSQSIVFRALKDHDVPWARTWHAHKKPRRNQYTEIGQMSVCCGTWFSQWDGEPVSCKMCYNDGRTKVKPSIYPEL